MILTKLYKTLKYCLRLLEGSSIKTLSASFGCCAIHHHVIVNTAAVADVDHQVLLRQFGHLARHPLFVHFLVADVGEYTAAEGPGNGLAQEFIGGDRFRAGGGVSVGVGGGRGAEV